jgi:hypothetical protein
MRTNFRKKFFYLQLYCAISTLLLGCLFVLGFTSQRKQKFSEIDVERINIVEKNGKLKMVISNKERQHPGIVDGKMFNERKGERPAGMKFFSEKGDEIGGLSFDGDTGKGQSGSLAFDKFRGDQTIQLTHQEDKDGNYFAGLRVNDQNMPLLDFLAKVDSINKLPTAEERQKASREFRQSDAATVSRLVIGKSRDKTSLIMLNDGKGKPRIKISVAVDGTPKLDFLDETGKVTYSLPENAAGKK